MGKGNQPGSESLGPLTLTGAEPTLITWCWVLGTRNSGSCHGEGLLQVLVTRLLPSLAVNPMVPAMLSEGLAVWAQSWRRFRAGGGEQSRCPRSSGRLHVGHAKGVRLQGFV